MKKIIATFCLLFSVSAFAAPPSDASLDELLAVTNVQQMVNGMDAQMNQMMNQNAMGNKPMQHQQQQVGSRPPSVNPQLKKKL